MTMLLPALVLLPLAAAPLPGLLRRVAGVEPTLPALLAALGALALALALLPGALTGEPAVASLPWVPALGLGLGLRADRTAVGLAVVVAGGGVLAIAFARRARRGRVAPRELAALLALLGATLGVVLADDLALLWCCLEVATLASVLLLGAARPRARLARLALGTLVAMEAGGLALLAAALIIADVAGGFGIDAAVRSAGELRAHPLYLAMVALALVAGITRLAPWLARAAGRGAWPARGAGLVAAAVVPLRLGAALGGTPPWLGLLVASGAGVVLLALWPLARGTFGARAAVPATGPALGDDLAVAARIVWQPLAAPRLGLSLLALALGAALAVLLGASGTRADAWPAPASVAWPLVAGSAWLLLAVAAAVVHDRSRRAARVLAGLAAGTLLVLAIAAPPAITVAAITAGTLALWRLARTLALPVPPRRGLFALGALVVLAALWHPLGAGLQAGPSAAVASGGAPRAALAVLAPLALPCAAMVLLFALGGAARAVRRVVAGLALLANLAVAAALLASADRGAAIGVVLGAWPTVFGLPLLLDRLAGEMLLVAAVLAALAFGHALVNPGAARGRHAEALGQLQLLGAAGCVLAADLLGLVVFFELLLLALQTELAADDAGGRAAAAHVAVVGAAGTALMLIAVASVYAALGTSGYAALAVRAPTIAAGDAPLLGVGAYLLLIVLALRAAALPLGLWLSRALEAAPAAAATGVIVATQIGVYGLLRLCVLVFPCFGAGPCGPSGLVLPFGLATVAAGGIGALAATRLRAIAAPLLLVSVGTLLVGVGSVRIAGITAALYALVPAALGAAALAFASDAAGRGRRVLGVVALLALLGTPPFPGWIGRLAILGASGADAFVVWTVVLSSALLATVAVARVAVAREVRPRAAVPAARRGAAAAACALVLLGAWTLATAPAFALASRAARQLFDRAAYVAAFPAPGSGAAAR